MPGTNLTRVEAAERAGVVASKSFEIELDLTRGPETFRSRTTLTFSATPGASTFLDLIADSVEELTLNGQAVDTAAFADSRITLQGLAAENTVVVDATCRYTNTGEGLHRFVDPADGEVYLYSQFEVADSRRVFAVFEQPDLKGTFQFTVKAPEQWVVVTGQPGTSTEAIEGARTWTFSPTEPLSSYVTAVIAGPYHAEHRTISSADGRTIPAAVYCRRSLAPYLEAEEVVSIAQAGFAFYEEAFKIPYPYEKYDQLFVPGFNAGAMENAGAVTFTETYVFRSKVPDATRERRVVTILHELAHMWFGDLVTMKWWDDLWLNESFAEFMSTLATAEATEWREAWTTFNSLEKSWAYNQDQLPSTHPIWAEMNDLEDVEVNFDGITYAKGASVLRQLVAWVGQENFLAGVAEYLKKHAWGNTVLNDLMVELEASSGRSLGEWTKVWLQSSGVNTLRPVIETEDREGAAVFTRVAIAQEPDASSGLLRPHRLAVGCYSLEGERLVRTQRIELDVQGALTEIPELVGAAQPDLLLINDDDLAYTKIRLDERSLATATEHLAGFESSLARSLVLAAAWDMTRDGEWPASRFVDLVLASIGSIQDSTVIMVLLRQLATAVQHYSAPASRGALSEKVGTSLAALAAEATAGSDLQFQLAKAAALHATTEEQLDRIAALRSGALVIDGLTIDTDLRWDLLVALAAGGRASAEEITAALADDTTSAGEQAAARARAALISPEAKAAAWESIMGGELGNEVQRATIAGFTQVNDRDLLLPYVEPYFESLISLWAERTPEMAEQIVVGTFPLKLAGLGVDVVARAEEWLSENPDAPAALKRLISESADTARRAVAAQQVDA